MNIYFLLLFFIFFPLSSSSIAPTYLPLSGNYTSLIQNDPAFKLALQTAVSEAQKQYSATHLTEVIQAEYRIAEGAQYRIVFAMKNKIFQSFVFVRIWDETVELISLKPLVQESGKSSGEGEQSGKRQGEIVEGRRMNSENETNSTEAINSTAQIKNTSQINSTNETSQLSEEKQKNVVQTVEVQEQGNIEIQSNILIFQEYSVGGRLLAGEGRRGGGKGEERKATHGREQNKLRSG